MRNEKRGKLTTLGPLPPAIAVFIAALRLSSKGKVLKVEEDAWSTVRMIGERSKKVDEVSGVATESFQIEPAGCDVAARCLELREDSTSQRPKGASGQKQRRRKRSLKSQNVYPRGSLESAMDAGVDGRLFVLGNTCKKVSENSRTRASEERCLESEVRCLESQERCLESEKLCLESESSALRLEQ